MNIHSLINYNRTGHFPPRIKYGINSTGNPGKHWIPGQAWNDNLAKIYVAMCSRTMGNPGTGSKRNKEMIQHKEISKKEKDDIRILIKFVGIFCRENHNGERTPFSFKLLDIHEIEKKKVLLCSDCTKLLTYGLTMRLKCPHDPKPMCKKCETQCYHGEYKAKIREVMKFSGMHMVKHGRLDMLYHYLR